MSGGPFSQVQREWFSARASLPSRGTAYSLADFQRAYWNRGSIPSVGMKPLSQTEYEWWDVITGGIARRTGNNSDSLEQALNIYSSTRPTKIANENEYNFYSSVTITSLA